MYREIADPRIQIEYYVIACLIAILIIVFGRRKRNIAAKAALIVYMFLVLASTVFSRPIMPYRIAMIVPGWSIISMIQTGSKGLAAEIILNVLMLVPVGVLLPLAYEDSDGWTVLVTAIVFSTLIEFSQLWFKLGWFEIDDIINNTIGALLGWLPVSLVVKKKERRYGQVFRFRHRRLN